MISQITRVFAHAAIVALLTCFTTIPLVLFVPPARAAPVKLSFTGIIQPGSLTYDGATGVSGNWDGRGFSGDISFDPLTTVVSTDNSTYQINNSYSLPALMSINLHLPDGVVISGDDMSSPAYHMQIYRNYVNPPNTNALLFNVDNHDYLPNGLTERYLHFDWEALDRLGASSTLFSDPNGGISYAQLFDLEGYPFVSPMIWEGHAQAGFFNLQGAPVGLGHVYFYTGYFALTSVTACSPFPGGGATGGCFPGPGPFPGLPEPPTLALLAIVLAGFGFGRRKRGSSQSAERRVSLEADNKPSATAPC